MSNPRLAIALECNLQFLDSLPRTALERGINGDYAISPHLNLSLKQL